MKKTKIFLLIAISCLISKTVSAQAYEAGRSFIGAGYGIGFGYKAFWSAYNTNTDFDSKTFGPWILKYDYGLSDKISAGAYLSNQSSSATWTTTIAGFPSGYTYDYKVTIGQLLAVGRGSYHFSVFNDRIDAYTGASMGYRKYTYKVDSDDENFKFDYEFGGAFGFGWHAGLRYEINDQLGAYTEVGAGQIAAIQLGAVLKL
jgi:hypothetical protein